MPFKPYDESQYYDKHSPTDGRVKVLFNGGRPLQAEEVNELQSVIQLNTSVIIKNLFKGGEIFDADGYLVFPFIHSGSTWSWNSSAPDYMYVAYDGQFLCAKKADTASSLTGVMVYAHITRTVLYNTVSDIEGGDLTDPDVAQVNYGNVGADRLVYKVVFKGSSSTTVPNDVTVDAGYTFVDNVEVGRYEDSRVVFPQQGAYFVSSGWSAVSSGDRAGQYQLSINVRGPKNGISELMFFINKERVYLDFVSSSSEEGYTIYSNQNLNGIMLVILAVV